MGLTIGRADKPAVSFADHLIRGLEVDLDDPTCDQLFSNTKLINASPSMGKIPNMGPQQIKNGQGGHQRTAAHFDTLDNKEARYKPRVKSVAVVQNVAKSPLTVVIPAKAILSRERQAVAVIDDDEDSDATICYGSDISSISCV